MSDEIESGLIQDIRDLEPGVLSASPADGTDKTADSDGTDTGDADGTDNGDAENDVDGDGEDGDGDDGDADEGDADGGDNA